ncbi:MAG: hypothetical protein JW782_02775 [Candidatus Saganbacteria bacterium]|nr:hypothetical protein [Candidatus Saganbacteria bacterium]
MLTIVARLLALAYIAFLVLMSLDVFNIIGFSMIEKVVGFIIHLIPAFLVAVCLMIAWKKETAGGLLLLILAVGFTFFFRTYRDPGIFMIATLPLIVVGTLFIVIGKKRGG